MSKCHNIHWLLCMYVLDSRMSNCRRYTAIFDYCIYISTSIRSIRYELIEKSLIPSYHFVNVCDKCSPSFHLSYFIHKHTYQWTWAYCIHICFGRLCIGRSLGTLYIWCVCKLRYINILKYHGKYTDCQRFTLYSLLPTQCQCLLNVPCVHFDI